jgi:hypothetical protein
MPTRALVGEAQDTRCRKTMRPAWCDRHHAGHRDGEATERSRRGLILANQRFGECLLSERFSLSLGANEIGAQTVRMGQTGNRLDRSDSDKLPVAKRDARPGVARLKGLPAGQPTSPELVQREPRTRKNTNRSRAPKNRKERIRSRARQRKEVQSGR